MSKKKYILIPRERIFINEKKIIKDLFNDEKTKQLKPRTKK